MTCPTCHNAHSDDCTPAALKARIAALSKDPDTIPRHLLVALSQAQRAFERRDCTAFGTINENVQPVADAALGWIREVERERDAYRKAKAENDDRFMAERDEARRERDTLRAKLTASQTLAEDLRARLIPALDAAGVDYDAMPASLAAVIGEREAAVDSMAGEINRLRAQLATLTAKADPRIGDLAAKVRAGDGTAEDLAVLCDVAGRVALLEALCAEKDEALAKADATIARLNRLAHG